MLLGFYGRHYQETRLHKSVRAISPTHNGFTHVTVSFQSGAQNRRKQLWSSEVFDETARPVFLSNFKHLWRGSTPICQPAYGYFVFICLFFRFFLLHPLSVFCLMPRSPLASCSHTGGNNCMYSHTNTHTHTHMHVIIASNLSVSSE